MASLIDQYLPPKGVLLDVQAPDKAGMLGALVRHLAAAAGTPPEQERSLFAAVVERESQGSTALGRGVAMPHARSPVLKAYHVVAARSSSEISGYRDMDDQPVRLFFLLAGPPWDNGTHLQVMGRLMRICRDATLRQRLLEAPSPEAFRALLVEAEENMGSQR